MMLFIKLVILGFFAGNSISKSVLLAMEALKNIR